MMDFKRFAQLLVRAERAGFLEEWLAFLLTPGEREDLQKRLNLIQALLQKQETQREISKNHQVSIAKITRGSNELKKISPELLAFLNKELKQL